MSTEFDLAKLSRYKRDVLAIRETDNHTIRAAKELTLILAQGFNVLKDLESAHARVATMVPDAEPITARNGQINGMTGNYTRLMSGTFYELAKAVDDRSMVRAWGPWKKAERKMPVNSRVAWKKILSLASGTGGSSSIKKYLQSVRHEVAHHFDGKALANGYSVFFQGELTPSSEFLYTSEGRSMEETRFYFADAAARQAEQEHLKASGADWNKVSMIARDFNMALRYLVVQMLEEFARVQRDQ